MWINFTQCFSLNIYLCIFARSLLYASSATAAVIMARLTVFSSAFKIDTFNGVNCDTMGQHGIDI